MGSTYAKLMMDQLLNIHALMNMYKISENEETRKNAAGWLPSLKGLMDSLERELTKPATRPTEAKDD